MALSVVLLYNQLAALLLSLTPCTVCLHLLSLLEQGWQHRELSLSAENKSMLDNENHVRKLLAAAPEHPSGGVAAAAAAAGPAAYPEVATLEAGQCSFNPG